MKRLTNILLLMLYILVTSLVLEYTWNLFAANIFRIEISFTDAIVIRTAMALCGGFVWNPRERVMLETAAGIVVIGFVVLLSLI